LNGEPRIRLVTLRFGGFAPSNILNHSLEIENFATDFVPDEPGVLRYPDDSPVPAIDLRFEIDHFALFAYESDKFCPASGFDVNAGF
jgi:hypothetical protein